jgi:hypothetical protein
VTSTIPPIPARHLVALKFGWDIVKAIEALAEGLAILHVDEVARLRKAEIDTSLQRSSPVLGRVADEITRLHAVEERLLALGRVWIRHKNDWWVKVIEQNLATEHPVRRELHGVILLAKELASKRELEIP